MQVPRRNSCRLMFDGVCFLIHGRLSMYKLMPNKGPNCTGRRAGLYGAAGRTPESTGTGHGWAAGRTPESTIVPGGRVHP